MLYSVTFICKYFSIYAFNSSFLLSTRTKEVSWKILTWNFVSLNGRRYQPPNQSQILFRFIVDRCSPLLQILVRLIWLVINFSSTTLLKLSSPFYALNFRQSASLPCHWIRLSRRTSCVHLFSWRTNSWSYACGAASRACRSASTARAPLSPSPQLLPRPLRRSSSPAPARVRIRVARRTRKRPTMILKLCAPCRSARFVNANRAHNRSSRAPHRPSPSLSPAPARFSIGFASLIPTVLDGITW